MDVSRKSCRITILIALSTLLLLGKAGAQAAPSAFGPGHPLWVGAEYSNVSASFPYQSGQRLEGAGAFAEFHLTYHLALTGDARFLHFGGYRGSTERSYLAGPEVFLFARGRLHPYGKALVGVGRIHYPYAIGIANYLAVAPGGGAEYRVSRRWLVRGEYEYQMWLNSPGYSNEPDHMLTPNGFHVGVAFRLSR